MIASCPAIPPTTTRVARRITSTSPRCSSPPCGRPTNALAGSEERGFIYVVEPTGPFEDDPNVTNKRFPGNVTRSYRTRHPMLVIDEVRTWEGHPPDVLQGMLDNITRLRDQGLDVIED